jgi:hypothetical protein
MELKEAIAMLAWLCGPSAVLSNAQEMALALVLSAAEKQEKDTEDAEKWRALIAWLKRTPHSFITMTGADDAMEALLEIIIPAYRKAKEGKSNVFTDVGRHKA